MKYSEAVKWFGKKMLKVLRENGYKDPLPIGHLFQNLQGEVLELHTELLKGRKSVEAIQKEAVDVANYAMMIALSAKGIELPAESKPTLVDSWPSYRYG